VLALPEFGSTPLSGSTACSSKYRYLEPFTAPSLGTHAIIFQREETHTMSCATAILETLDMS